MKDLINKIKQYNKITDLEGRMFFFFGPVFLMVQLVSVIIAIIEKVSLTSLTACLLCFVITLVINLIYSKNKKYAIGLMISYIINICVLVPINLFILGGIHSIIPVIMGFSSVICCLCISKKYRNYIFALTLIINTCALILAINHPELVTAVPERIENFDFVVSFVIYSIGMFLVVNFVVNYVMRFNEILDTHMDESVVNSLFDDNIDISGKQKVAVMFIDINGFTSNTEKMPIDLVKEYLNTFFDVCSKYNSINKGVFDKCIGDCAMLYWIETKECPNPCSLAAKTAYQIKNELMKESDINKQRFGEPLECSAGISYGEVIVGDIGSSERKDFTIIGDTVNLASRLESLAIGRQICITKQVAEKINDEFYCVPFENKVRVKGKKDELEVYTIEQTQ